MTAAHPEAARAKLEASRRDLLLRAANLATELHDPLRPGLTLAAIYRDANVIAIGALVKAARAAAAHVARLAAPPVAPRLTLASADLVLHRGAGLWSELVAVAQRPTCAVCDARVEHASVARDVARCSTIVAVACHGETETMTIADWLEVGPVVGDLVAFRGAARRAVNGS